jgi:hypothetical protein
VVQTVADTFVSKRRRKKGGSKGPPSTSVVQDAQKQTSAHRTNENATSREPLDEADTGAAYDADGRKTRQSAATEKTTHKDGSSRRRESKNDAAELAAEAAGCPEGLKSQHCAIWLMSVLGVDFPVEILKIGQPVHRQPVFVLFALDVHFHQMPGQPFTGPLGLGTVCQSAVYAQRAIDG